MWCAASFEPNHVALILDSTTCASRSGIGPLMLALASRTFKGKKLTSLMPSVGQGHTVSRLSSTSTVPQEVRTGINQTCVPIFIARSHRSFTILQFRQLGSKVVVPPVADESDQCQSHECNCKAIGLSVPTSLTGCFGHCSSQRVRNQQCVLYNTC